MLKAVRKHMLSREYGIFNGEHLIASLNWTHDTIEIGGSVFDLYWFTEKGGVLGRIRYAIEYEGKVMATSEEPQHPRFKLTVGIPGSEYTFKTPSFFTISKFDLFKAGEKIGGIYADNWYQAKITINLPSEIPPPVQMFMFWLVLHVSNSVSSVRMMRIHSYKDRQ